MRNIFNLYIEKDIVSFFGIENTTKFMNLTVFLSSAVSSLFSLSAAAHACGMKYAEAAEMLDILEHTYVIRRLKPYHGNLVTEIKKAPKVYFIDSGIRNSAIKNFAPFGSRQDKGALMENFVFRHLLDFEDEWDLRFWRTAGKAEVDFVLAGKGEIVPIEVKASAGALGKSFHSFLNAYRPKRAVIVTLSDFGVKRIGDTVVQIVPAHYF